MGVEAESSLKGIAALVLTLPCVDGMFQEATDDGTPVADTIGGIVQVAERGEIIEKRGIVEDGYTNPEQ